MVESRVLVRERQPSRTLLVVPPSRINDYMSRLALTYSGYNATACKDYHMQYGSVVLLFDPFLDTYWPLRRALSRGRVVGVHVGIAEQREKDAEPSLLCRPLKVELIGEPNSKQSPPSSASVGKHGPSGDPDGPGSGSNGGSGGNSSGGGSGGGGGGGKHAGGHDQSLTITYTDVHDYASSSRTRAALLLIVQRFLRTKSPSVTHTNALSDIVHGAARYAVDMYEPGVTSCAVGSTGVCLHDLIDDMGLYKLRMIARSCMRHVRLYRRCAFELVLSLVVDYAGECYPPVGT